MDTAAQQRSFRDFFPLVGFILFFVAFYLLLMRADTFMKLQAIDNCSRVGRYETTVPGDNAKVTYPLPDQYASCLKKVNEVIK
ncbi:MAG TPA: hypothetical protein VLF68_03545 [Candidatus Saccharimonadales bacterium]|nr:hypothetical protein [Candidatus Saccharimonadales bacterium]